jgi:hypothetical protein
MKTGSGDDVEIGCGETCVCVLISGWRFGKRSAEYGKMFGPEGEEGTGDRRKLHSEELYGVYWQHKIWNMRRAGSVTCVGEKKYAFVGNPEGNVRRTG